MWSVIYRRTWVCRTWLFSCCTDRFALLALQQLTWLMSCVVKVLLQVSTIKGLAGGEGGGIIGPDKGEN